MSKSAITHIAECAFLLALAYMAAMRLIPAVPTHPQVLIFLTAEFLGVLLIIVQRPGQVATSLKPVLVGFAGTAAALTVIPKGVQLAPDIVSTLLTFGGMMISILAKLSLRRSFGLVAANRGVKSGGLYRLVRHPMYMGYILSHVGYLLVYLSAWNVAVIGLAWIMLWMRTDEEEKVLRGDAAYRAYAGKVRSRLVPGVI